LPWAIVGGEAARVALVHVDLAAVFAHAVIRTGE
jgi:hypothetical protein